MNELAGGHRTIMDVARNIVNQLGDLWEVPVDVRQTTNDQCDEFVEKLIIDFALPLAPDVTRSVEIPEAARKAAAKRLAEFGAWPDGPHAAWMTESDALRFADAALEAALPYLAPAAETEGCTSCGYPSLYQGGCTNCGASAAPAGDGGLREALERQLATLPTVAFDNGYPVQALPKSELLSLLALYPAAPAVPQPVDREALRAHLLKAEVVRADGGYWDTPTPQEAGRIADAVLAVSAGEQEQVET